MDIIKEWFTTIGLPPNLEKVEEEFSNGYRFGEVLQKLGLFDSMELL